MKLVALKDVCRITNGGTPKSGIADFWHGDVAWLTPAEMGKRKTPEISETARTISQAGLAGSSAKLVPANSVILSTRAPIGHLAINQAPMAFNQGCRGLTPGDYLDTKFLYYFLYFSREALDGLGTGTTFKELSSSSLANFRIPLPLLDEQQRIVAVLDKAFAAIATGTANAQKNQSNARTLFESYQSRLFREAGKSVIPLGKMASFRNGLNFTGSSRGEIIRIVGVKDFQNRLWVPDANLAAVQIDGRLADTDILQEGDILTVRSNGNRELIGRCMVAPAMSAKTSHSGFTIRIRPDASMVDANYLCRILKSPQTRKLLVDGGNGASISSLNQQLLGSLPVPVPSKAKQFEIVSAIDAMTTKVARLNETINAKLATLAELKQSLLHKAFAGELTAAFTTPQFTAQIIAFAHRRHQMEGQQLTYGRVKAQKSLHLVESIGGVDLGRQPMKDAAGPNDFQHMLRAEEWAETHGFFKFVPRASGKGYDFKKLVNYDTLWVDAVVATKSVAAALERAIDPIVPMVSLEAELFATVHAAWNNLIIDGAAITDDAIVKEARDDWHPDKLKIPEHKFRDTIRTIKTKGMEPDGSAKYVGGQVSLF